MLTRSRFIARTALRWLRGSRTDEEVRSVAAALALALYLAALKLRLARWWIVVKGVRPLGDLRPGWVPLVAAADLLLCAVLAVVFFSLYGAAKRFPSGARSLARALPPLLACAVAAFSAVSFKVTEVYGTPLGLDHLHAFGGLGGMRDSIAAYATRGMCAVLAVGLLAGAFGGRLLAPPLARSRWLSVRWRLWAAFLGPTALMCALASVRLRGVYTYGLKHDAVLSFLRSVLEYVPARSFDAAAALRRLPPLLYALDPEYRRFPPIGPGRRGVPGLRPSPRRPLNVVFIMMESTSAPYLDGRTTPNLMRLAMRGTSLDRHFTTVTVSYKAVYSMFYSDYMVDLGALPRQIYKRRLPQVSLADVLRSRGYATAYFASSYLEYQDLAYLLDGFDTRVGAEALRTRGGATWAWGVHEEQTVGAISEWVHEHKRGRFFLFYETMFPHHPYHCPLARKPFPTDAPVDRYRNALYYADMNVGRVVDLLEREGLRESTLIVVVGDHGETVGPGASGHGISMTMRELRVPFILSVPEGLRPGARADLYTNHLDLAPTIVGLVGGVPPAEWLGRDLSAVEVAPRVLEVSLEQSRQCALVDQGLLYSVDPTSGRATLRRIEGDGLAPLDPRDPARGLLRRYERRLAHFEEWVLWRHLRRAVEGELVPAR